MRILRSVNRRGFSVGTAGFFTVLRPNTWFPASRLPGEFRYRSGPSKGVEAPAPASAAEREVPDQSDIQEAATPSLILKPRTHDHRLTRLALVILAATAITSVLLWLINRAP